MLKDTLLRKKKEWLFPEKICNTAWENIKSVLLPSDGELFHFGGEMYVGYEDGSTYYQDEFGREYPEHKYLKKDIPKNIKKNDPCGCGSGRKYKKCCEGKLEKDRPSWNVLSIRERNIILYRGIYDILGLNKDKSWDDIRRELSNEQIVDIYKLYWSLWPIETDLFELLPRPDTTLRVVYTGILDPRTILLPLSTVPYFDEVIIQHPFIHPKAVNPDFSPIENPHQHKYQTLKNILLFLYLEPFVRMGKVNFIPDPCMFNNFLHREMMQMAEERRGDLPLNKAEAARVQELGRDDFARTMRGLKKEQLINQIKRSSPELSQDEVDSISQYMKNLNEDDPLALLQDDLYDHGGQTLTSMSTNFEMTLFIAQATGSAIITDSPTRWEEVSMAQVRTNGVVSYPYKSITDLITENKFIFCVETNNDLYKTIYDNAGKIRNCFREILNAAKQGSLIPPDISLINRYKSDFQSSLKAILKNCHKKEEFLFHGRMNFLIPSEGFVHNNVQRLLLKSGSEHHLNKVPMAIFFDLDNL